MLQAPSLDLKKPSDLILDTLSISENKQKDCDDLFQKNLSEVKELRLQLDVDVRTPRLAGRGKNRANIQPVVQKTISRRTSIIIFLTVS